jgi:hypothetical protein
MDAGAEIRGAGHLYKAVRMFGWKVMRNQSGGVRVVVGVIVGSDGLTGSTSLVS